MQSKLWIYLIFVSHHRITDSSCMMLYGDLFIGVEFIGVEKSVSDSHYDFEVGSYGLHGPMQDHFRMRSFCIL